MKTPKTSRVCYFAAIYNDEDGGYWSRFVDFPGADQGDDIDDAVQQLTFFLQGIIDEMSLLHKELPQPTGIENVKAKLDKEDGEPVCIVPIFAYPPAPAVRIQVTAKANQIAEIDAYARRNNLTRSDVLIQSALAAIRAQ